MCIFLYTDGASLRSGDGGWAFVAVSNGREMHSDSGRETNTTNNRMELVAIIKAMAWANSHRLDNVIIVTDSRYAIAVLTRPAKANPFPLPKNNDLIKLGRLLIGSIRFEWVKGHSGNRWNDRADYLAGNARDGAGSVLQIRRPPRRSSCAVPPKRP